MMLERDAMYLSQATFQAASVPGSSTRDAVLTMLASSAESSSTMARL
jgi:hypothetical protein